ncbi:hypothetical protein RRG08_049184 [Elysia crispata]|uniref:Uncharacterized protein n=1 Tax=Elysia crispata TaxID=231223 RepID=A0AAE1AR36_9GAST|nr:hypothetical protein RRG08_049184 [Elysia crispata]
MLSVPATQSDLAQIAASPSNSQTCQGRLYFRISPLNSLEFGSPADCECVLELYSRTGKVQGCPQPVATPDSPEQTTADYDHL